MKRFVVIGLGNFGASVAEALNAQGHDVLAVDTSEEAVERVASFVASAVVADGRGMKTMERVGARNADAAVISTGDDITASILTTMALRDLGVREIYVKVISIDHARVMEKLGVTETIFPERDSAQRLAQRITTTSILNFVRLGTGFGMQEMAVPEGWVGESLRTLELPRRFGISVIALHDMLTDSMVPTPNPDAPLKESDTLLIAGADADLKKLASEK